MEAVEDLIGAILWLASDAASFVTGSAVAVDGGFTAHPSFLKAQIAKLVGYYPVDVREFRTNDKERLRREIFEMNRKQWGRRTMADRRA